MQEFDTVRVVRLGEGVREFSGSEGVMRAPAVGDVATICHVYEPDDPGTLFAVEMVEENGYTVWLADFSRDELELVEGTGDQT